MVQGLPVRARVALGLVPRARVALGLVLLARVVSVRDRAPVLRQHLLPVALRLVRFRPRWPLLQLSRVFQRRRTTRLGPGRL
jgi:hypothetical protein